MWGCGHHSVLFYVPLCAFPSAYQIITLGMKVSRLCLLLLVIGLTYSSWSKFHCVCSWLFMWLPKGSSGWDGEEEWLL